MNKLSFSIAVSSIALGTMIGSVALADQTPPVHLSSVPITTDHGTWHLTKQVSDQPITSLGKVNDSIVVGFSPTGYEWLFRGTIVPVVGADPGKALGYSGTVSAASTISLPKKSPCASIKKAISAVTISDTKTLCLLSTVGGDFSLELLPEKTITAVGFGKQPILDKTSLTWFGYDGNLYIAHLHPSFFDTAFSSVKTKTDNTVFLLRNNLKYFLPNEQTFYSWFDSFKAVKVVPAQKMTTYMDIGKASFKPNALITFSGSPEIYVYQPANDPYLLYGKTIGIIDNQPDHWMLQKTGVKTPIKLMKRPVVLRHIATESELVNLYGPTWSKQIITLAADKKSDYTIATKDFNVKTDLIIE